MKILDILCLFFIILLVILVCGCGDYHSAYYRYFIGMYGLENYTNGGSTEILVPIPVMGGEPIFNDSMMMNSTSYTKHHSQWKPKVVMSEKGKMCSFSTSGNGLTNVYLTLDFVPFANGPIENDNRTSILDNLLITPFYPVTNWSELNYSKPSPSVPFPSEYKHNYTSYIYIDKQLMPISGKNHTIEFFSRLEINEGSYSNVGKSYVILIDEYIPEGVNGWVPVTVYVL